MSEYWKSTPKYWCKFCSDFVKDTTFSRKEHDATPKHQRNIQRSLRDLHRGKEREDREKQRAQAEIARLNGVVPSTGSAAPQDLPWKQTVRKAEVKEAPKQASAEERKKQIAKLAEMGVAVPEEYRREMAMAGGWEVTAVRPLDNSEEPAGPLSVGVRKRKIDDEEEEAKAAEEKATKRKGWGQAFKEFPGSKGGDEDLDVLMSIGKRKGKTELKEEDGVNVEEKDAVKLEVEDIKEGISVAEQDMDARYEPILKEEQAEKALSEIPAAGDTHTPPNLKVEEPAAAPAVVFKKRKKAAKPA